MLFLNQDNGDIVRADVHVPQNYQFVGAICVSDLQPAQDDEEHATDSIDVEESVPDIGEIVDVVSVNEPTPAINAEVAADVEVMDAIERPRRQAAHNARALSLAYGEFFIRVVCE